MNAVLQEPAVRDIPRATIPDAQMLPVGLLRPNPWNRQVSEKRVAEMAESIRKYGVLQPVLVRPIDGAKPGEPLYELIAGEHRWRASQAAEQALIPALVRPMDDLEVIELSLIENLQREGLLIDIFWRCDGKVCGTSVEVGAHPLQAVQAAQAKRYEYTGDKHELSPRAAWLRMRRAAGV